LKIGVIFASFSSSGKTPLERDLLNIFDKGPAMILATFFIIEHGMLSRPDAFFEGIYESSTNMFKIKIARGLC
jgi:hypothetical protein